eukprot:2216000-Prymnesium_polylepis.1
MPLGGPPSARRTAPRVAQRHGAKGMKSHVSYHPRRLSSPYSRATASTPPSTSHSESSDGKMTIWWSRSAFIRTPARMKESSSLSMHSSSSCSSRAALVAYCPLCARPCSSAGTG